MKNLLIFTAGVAAGAVATYLLISKPWTRKKQSDETIAKWEAEKQEEEMVEETTMLTVEETEDPETESWPTPPSSVNKETYDSKGNAVPMDIYTIVDEETAEYYLYNLHWPDMSVKYYAGSKDLIDPEFDSEYDEPKLKNFMESIAIERNGKNFVIIDELNKLVWNASITSAEYKSQMSEDVDEYEDEDLWLNYQANNF